MYYLKDTQNGNILEFETLASIQRQFNLDGLVNKRDVQRKRLIKNRYVLSDTLDFSKPKKQCRKRTVRNFIVYFDDSIKEYTCTTHDLAETLDIPYNSLRQYVNTSNRCGGKCYVYHKGNEIKHLQPKNKTFYVLDLEFGNITTKFTTLKELAESLNLKQESLRTCITSRQRIKGRYYINYDNDFTIMAKKKKKNPIDKKPKPDLNVNGEFVRKEPNKPAVRKGKLGLDNIKQRLKNGN